MDILATLLTITIPVFLVVGAGYASVKTAYLPDALAGLLVQYATRVAVPCLLFQAMVATDLAQAVSLGALVAFFAAGTACFLGAMAASRAIWRRRPGESVAVGFCAFFPNVVMLGIPIAERAYGAEAAAPIFGIIAFHSIYNYFLGFVAMEAVRRDRDSIWAGMRRAFVTTFQNPLMVGLVAGMAVNLSGLALPGLVDDALAMVTASALPTALFSLGAVLTQYRLRAEAGEALMVSLFSLIVHPALALVIAHWGFGLGTDYVRAAVVLAAMPAGINGYIFATLYDRAVGTAASAALIGTVLSLGTVTAWLAILQAIGL